MAQSDPPTREGIGEERRAHLAVMLHRYVANIETIIENLGEGDFGEAAQLPRVKREMLSTAKQLRDVEIELDEHRKRDEGRVAGAAEPIDMDAARDTIGRRLNHLRDVRRPESVS